MSATEWSDVDMAELLPTGTVTLLLADVEGSTQLWESQPAAMTAALALLNRTASKVIAEHDGVRPVEQGEGDSFVAAFARAGDAVACALNLQRADLAPIKLRIGVHTGDVQLRDEGNYAGPTINKTARLRDLAHGGQTVLSSVTEELVEDQLPADAWLTDLGRHALRDLPRPIRVTQLCHPDIRNDFPPLRTSNALAAHHLPAQLTTFVGRHTQMADIRALLADNRLVTLTGAGGAGKTRLAIEVAGDMTDQFADGIWYVDLAPITHPGMVPLTVGRALGLPDQAGSSMTETLLRFVRDRHMLFVLDNCEHLLEASAAVVNDILGSCSRVTILATSREPLMVAGEVNWQVPSLSLADEAIELFADRARRGRPDFTLENNVEMVTEICQRLDGMPLAIELAAARVRALSLDEIVDSLHDRFRLLTGGARTAVRRQQTLRASVDWSHALLTEPERVLLRRLSVFMAGFDLDAAQSVAGATDVERYQVLDQLSLLVDKSLVIAESAGGRTRYRLLETVRQYALEKLGESGEADDTRARHRDHYAAMAARLDAPARTSKEHLVEQADRELDNLRAAFTWSCENDDVASALELATSLHPLWMVRGRVAEGAAWLDAALEGLRDSGIEVAPPIRAKALADRAMLGLWAAAGTDTVDQAEEALAIAREVDDPALLSRVLTACGSAHAHDYESARPYFTEATTLARALGDNWRLCQIFSRQSNGGFASGEDIADAEAVAREGMELADALGDQFGSDQCRLCLVTAHSLRGQVGIAIELIRDLIVRADRAHDLMSKVIGLFEETYVLAFHGDAAGARASARAMIEAGNECPGLLERQIQSAVTAACLADGDLAKAWEAALAAERVGIIIPGVDDLHMVWTAQAALAHGELEVARRRADVAVSASKGSWLAISLSTRARVRIAQLETDHAASDAYESLMVAHETGAHLVTADTLECLSRLTFDVASHSESARLLGAAHAHRQRLGLVRFKVFDDDHHELVSAVRKAMGDADFDAAWNEGDALSTDEAIAYALRGRGERKRPSTGWGSLTPTELDVVRLVAEGIPNKDIATRLFISPRTVQSHLRHVYNKLGLMSRVQLAQEAARH